jgi:hypothetical protein
MRKIFFLSLFIFSFISCKNTESKESPEKIIKQEYLPLFISLSPKMTDNEFKEEISNLNDEKKLDFGDFVIPVNDKTYKFKVNKNRNYIQLFYHEEKKILIDDFDRSIADEYIRDAEMKTRDINKVFEDKYGIPKIKFPADVSLSDCKWCSMYSNIYQDSSKTVLVCYDIYGTRDPKIVVSSLFRTDGNDEYVEGEDVYFGFGISIYYYYNEDFDSFFRKVISDTKSKEIDRLRKIEKTLEERKKAKENLRNNLKSL